MCAIRGLGDLFDEQLDMKLMRIHARMRRSAMFSVRRSCVVFLFPVSRSHPHCIAHTYRAITCVSVCTYHETWRAVACVRRHWHRHAAFRYFSMLFVVMAMSCVWHCTRSRAVNAVFSSKTSDDGRCEQNLEFRAIFETLDVDECDSDSAP